MDTAKNESTALTVASNERMMAAVYNEIDDGYANIPLSLPYLNTDHKQGNFVLSLDERRFEELDVVIMSTRRSRCHFNPKIGSAPAWYCRCAEDGVKNPGEGILNVDELNDNEQAMFRSNGAGGLCVKCPNKNWGANKEKPACTESINLLLWIRGENQFAIFKAARTSLKPTTDYLNSFRYGVEASGQKKHYIDYVTKMTLEKQSKPGMFWFNPRYARGEALSDEQRIEVMSMYVGIAEALKNTLKAEPEPIKDYQIGEARPVSEAEGFPGGDEIDADADYLAAQSEKNIAGAAKSEHIQAIEYMTARGITEEEASAEWQNIGTLNGIIRKYKSVPIVNDENPKNSYAY